MLFVNLRSFAGISEEIASNISITSERGFQFYETKLEKNRGRSYRHCHVASRMRGFCFCRTGCIPTA